MARPELEPFSVDWWLRRLEKELDDRQASLKLYGDYYEGDHRLAFASEKFRVAFGTLFKEFADNWCPLVVDAVVERLQVVGFRFDPEDPSGDMEAWRIWQTNGLDADSEVAL